MFNYENANPEEILHQFMILHRINNKGSTFFVPLNKTNNIRNSNQKNNEIETATEKVISRFSNYNFVIALLKEISQRVPNNSELEKVLDNSFYDLIKELLTRASTYESDEINKIIRSNGYLKDFVKDSGLKLDILFPSENFVNLGI